jgi:sugar phosphate isomerase/epimerase
LAATLRYQGLLASEAPPAKALLSRLGVQLYTLRSVLPSKPADTIRGLAAIGYKEVEALRPSLPELSPLFKENGLKCVSGHFEAPFVTGNWKPWLPALEQNRSLPPKDYDWSAAVADAAKHGLRYMVIAYLMPSERGGLDFFRKFADQLNQAGEVCKKSGLTLCYHNHAFEFQKIDGTTPLDLLMERCEPGLVGLELDVFWSSVAGVDPVQVLKRYQGRIPLVHLKDKAKGTPQQFQESGLPKTAFKEIGNGELDFAAILKAASQNGVKHYFVEQDQCPGDPLDSLRQSYENLKKLA